MKKILAFTILMFLNLATSCFAYDVYYCGNYVSSYTYNAKIFEQQFLQQSSTETCTFKIYDRDYLDPHCVKMYERNVADYNAGRCKRMPAKTQKELTDAKRQGNRQLYYEIYNSIGQ